MEAWDISIFDRAEEVSVSVGDTLNIPFEKKDIAKLRELRKFSVSKKGKTQLVSADIITVKNIVPVCRVASVATSEERVSIQMNPSAGCVK